MHFDYEQASIAAIEYDLLKLPDDAQLAADYEFMLDLYRSLWPTPYCRFAAVA